MPDPLADSTGEKPIINRRLQMVLAPVVFFYYYFFYLAHGQTSAAFQHSPSSSAPGVTFLSNLKLI